MSRSSVKSQVSRALWIVKLMVLSLTLRALPLLGLRNSRTEVWLMMIRLDTLLKLKVTHIQREKPSLVG